MSARKLTKAQRRVLSGFLRTQRETLAGETWLYVPNYGQRGRSYYGIIDKLVCRGYISKHQVVHTDGWWISMNLVTDKGYKALSEVRP